MAKLRRSRNPFNICLLECFAARAIIQRCQLLLWSKKKKQEGDELGDERLPDGDDALLDTGASSLDHQKVVLDDTVANEATHGRDLLLGRVERGRGIGLVFAFADAVNLLVALGTVVVTVLTGTRDRVHDLGRMPGTDTGDLAKTLVRLARKLLRSPSVSHTLETFTLGDGNDVNVLVLLEQVRDLDSLFKVRFCEFDLVGDRATVDLDLHKMGLLLCEAGLADLGVGKDTNDRAVLRDAFELASDRRRRASFGVLFGVLCEGLLL